MKIVFVVMRFGKDGLATNILELTRGLINKGHELHIITSGFKSISTSDTTFFEELKSEFNTLGVHLHYFTEPSGNALKKIVTSICGCVCDITAKFDFHSLVAKKKVHFYCTCRYH